MDEGLEGFWNVVRSVFSNYVTMRETSKKDDGS